MTPPSGLPPGRRRTLLREQEASPTRPPQAGPPGDLLRARNVYAVVLVTVVVYLTFAVTGWLSHSSGESITAATGTPGAATATPAPSSTPLASATPGPSRASPAAATPTPSAAPPPSGTSAPITPVAQLAAAYERAAREVNEATNAARVAWDRSARTLADAKRLASAYAAADLAFIRAVQAIPWYGDDKALARRVLTPDNLRYVACGLAAASTTWAEYDVHAIEDEAAETLASAASNELRIALACHPFPWVVGE